MIDDAKAREVLEALKPFIREYSAEEYEQYKALLAERLSGIELNAALEFAASVREGT
jgi:hypothetical protein